LRKIIILLCISFILSGYTTKEFKISGYYPYTASKHEKHIEGGKFDCFGQKLKVLRDNQIVSIAVDKRIIPLNSFVLIEAFPNKIFHACDVGSKVQGAKIDICVWDKKTAWTLPKKSKITIIDKKYAMKLFFKDLFLRFQNEIPL